jgi:hypothetical protein
VTMISPNRSRGNGIATAPRTSESSPPRESPGKRGLASSGRTVNVVRVSSSVHQLDEAEGAHHVSVVHIGLDPVSPFSC